MTEKQFDSSIRLINCGDKDGLKQIYSEYGKMIFTVMKASVKNSHDAEDLTADFFLKLWQIADKYRFGGGHKRFLVVMARNMSLDFLRKNGREALDIDNIDDEHNEPSSEIATESDVIGNMTVREALDTLNEKEREIINLKIYAEMTFEEIAEIMKSPLGTVSWRYKTAIEKLKKRVKEAAYQ